MSDVCADPANADSDYCRERLPGESIAEWRDRRLRESPLHVTVRRGVPMLGGVPWWAWGALAFAVLWYLRDD